MLDEIPPQFREMANAERAKLEEKLAETSDYLTRQVPRRGDKITFEDMVRGIREATCNGKITPVFCGSALRNKGVQRLLDGVRAFLPSPLDEPTVKATNPKTDEPVDVAPDPMKPPVALVFKTISDKHGDLTFVRVYQGTLDAGHAGRSTRARASPSASRTSTSCTRTSASRSRRREAGQICAAVGLKLAATGDTLCLKEHAVRARGRRRSRRPSSRWRSRPRRPTTRRSSARSCRSSRARTRRSATRSTARPGSSIIYGMGELHLEIIRNRIVRDYGVQANVGKPRVAYRQTIGGQAKVNHKYAKQSGGRGQFAQVVHRGRARARRGRRVRERDQGRHIPREYIPAVEAGVA